MIVRPFQLDDINHVLALEAESFKQPWRHEHFLYDFKENPYAFIFIAEQNGMMLGYIDFWIMFEEATINKIAVLPNLRERSIGSTLLNDALNRMRVGGVIRVSLEVRVSNQTAIDFYSKRGFRVLLRKSQYYQDGEDAFYMVQDL
ncbi:MAG: ribosomal protein S18-alanine N-acetyltransferase [Bacteroidales bacterium]|jgi:ribosomal-protein-alanine N-acetyltransferase|nr:ribosomal protein S18-alanine N-acetyltransferase [Bacteroidales bacterium]